MGPIVSGNLGPMRVASAPAREEKKSRITVTGSAAEPAAIAE